MNEKSSPPPGAHSEPSSVRDDTVLDWARSTGAAGQLERGLDRYLRRRRRRRLAAASTALGVLLVASVLWFPRRGTGSIARASAIVVRPEQRTLPDGSTLELNAGADITVSFSDSLRRVTLRQGEVHFQVAKDAQRPFVVSAGAIEVHAVGTAFAVDLGSRSVDVVVTEGRVAVNPTAAVSSPSGAFSPSSPPSPTAVDAGWRVVIEPDAVAAGRAALLVSEISAADLQARLAWRVPRLKFASTPLGQVVAMFNEHAVTGRDARLVLAPGMPANLRVSGTLRSDDVDSLLRLLAAEFGITSEARPGEIVLHRK